MSTCIDYFKQISRGNDVNEELLEKRYREFLNFIYKIKATDIDRQKELIQLRYDYLVGAKLLEGNNRIRTHEELKEEYDKIMILSKERMKELNNKARMKAEKTNPYRNLNVPQNADKERIDSSYLAQLKNLEKSFEKEESANCKNLENIIDIYGYYLLFSEAREILLDPIKRRNADEDILLGFNPNQENVYLTANVSNLKYIPNFSKTVPYEIKNKYGDTIIFEHIGNLEYSSFGKKHPIFQDKETLQNYKIHKIYNSLKDADGNIPEKEFNVFTYLNINQMSSDESFTAVHSNVLFSDINMEEAIEHNGGYIGEVEYDDNRIVINHSQDKLMACKEYRKQ